MEFEDYERISFPVKAKQVTLGNIHELAAHCKATVEERSAKMLGTTIKLPVIRLAGYGEYRNKTFTATIGCWIVEHKGSFRIYQETQFASMFHKIPNTDDLVALAEDVVKQLKENGASQSRIDEAAEVLEQLMPDDDPFVLNHTGTPLTADEISAHYNDGVVKTTDQQIIEHFSNSGHEVV
jgi:hypothetical protein